MRVPAFSLNMEPMTVIPGAADDECGRGAAYGHVSAVGRTEWMALWLTGDK